MDKVRGLWHNLPLGSKLAVLASLQVMVVVFGLTFLTVQREQASFRQELESQVDLLLETLPLTMRDSLYRLELDELLDVAKVVSDNDDVTLFIVYDRDGAILVDASLAEPVFAQVVDPLGQRLVEAGSEQTYLDWRQGELVAGRSVSLGNQQIGAVAIGLSTEPLDQKIDALTRQSLLLAAITLVLGGSLAFWIARQITTPLGELARVASHMAGGDLHTRVGLRSKDEVGQLGSAFDQMADAIERRETDLRDLASSLERTVAERTAELRQQNRALAKANQALASARKQAEEANRAKSAFLNMVSHELRTPLTSVLGFVRIIEKRLEQTIFPAVDGDDRRVRRAADLVQSNIDIILSEGERLTTLINDMLDLAKIESGRLEWSMQPLSLGEVVEQSVAATAVLFEEGPLDLVVDVQPDLPPIVGDRDRLIQVVVNLLSNAVKFTDEGTVTCRAHLAASNSGGEEIVVSVVDTGLGIAPADQARVFEQFVQVGDDQSDRPKGTGLGLPICKSIVEHHGGRIWVESQGVPGQGSTFSFALPVSAPGFEKG